MKTGLSDNITCRVPLAHPGDTAGHILDEIRKHDYDEIRYVFIVDDQDRLKGYTGLDLLLKCNAADTIDKLTMSYHSVDIEKSLEHAATYAIHQKIPVVPVTNKQGVFLGILSAQTIIETLRREHIEDIHKLAGIRKETAIASEAIQEPPVRSVKHRLPWLLVGLTGSFLATFIMARYENMLNTYIALSFFIPGIVYLADAIGTQTETIVIRGLSLSWSTFARVLKKELVTGFLIGLILALLSVPAVILGGYDIRISLVVGTTIVMAGIVATSIGLFLPWLLHRLGRDPAYGSGPLATIIQDILSILVYLLIAKAMLG